MKPISFLLLVLVLSSQAMISQERPQKTTAQTVERYQGLQWRNIGPFRGGRSVASTGVIGQPGTFYMGSTGGGVWKSIDYGISWKNVSDGFFNTGTVGAIAVSESDPNVVVVGMGEHAARGVMTSMGDGVYKSTDGGATWQHIGLGSTRHISDVLIHPINSDVLYVAAQGAQYGESADRGVYRSTDGGETWEKVLYIDSNTGASSLSMDMNNPRILYASMWQHRRYPWTMESGGPSSGLYKSVDGGDSWEPLNNGLPATMGKSGISVSRADGQRVYAVIEAEGEQGGVYRSDNAGRSWKQVNKDRVNIARSWYYMEIFADPQNANQVYVLNAPVMKSIDGGKSFTAVPTPHGDNHHLWIHPHDNSIMINSNDGGANVSTNGGQSWSTQTNQPTAQFYRVITDNRFPYYVYGGQQDNSAIAIASRTSDGGIDWKDWYSVAGCESAFLAFDPDEPEVVFGGCYQGIIDRWMKRTGTSKPINEYPELGLSKAPEDARYRFNWNAPIISSPHDRSTIYHAGNRVFKTSDGGQSWQIISPDLTRNEEDKHGPGGGPFTNEAAGGENYNTISYLVESPHEVGVLYAGSDDGLIHLTRNGGASWTNVTPKGLQEGIVNSIEVSPHDKGTAYAVVMRYKFMDLQPYIYKTNDYGASWERIDKGINREHTFVRVVREDPKRRGLLYAGTETGLFVSWDDGRKWEAFQANLPVVPINDLIVHGNDLVAATAGRSFWILDGLTPLRFQEESRDLALYKPEDSYLFFGGAGKAPGLGTNPPSGVAIDYYLEEQKDSIPLVLEILQGERVIRKLSSEKNQDFKSWPGGPPKPAVLPAKAGFNRFYWDFRRDPLPAVTDVFVFGNLQGAHVGPGTYGLRLSRGEQLVQTRVTIKALPETSSNPSDFARQQELLETIEGMVLDIHRSVNQMRSAAEQLSRYQELLKDQEKAQPLLEKANELQRRITSWEENLIQADQKTFQDVINFNNKLNAELLFLKGFVEGLHPRPTEGAQERLRDLQADWKTYSDERDAIIKQEMEAFNRLFRELEIPAIIMDTN